MPHNFRAVALLIGAIVLAAAPAAAQDSKYLLQYNGAVRRTPNPMNVTITGAKSWGTGFSQRYVTYNSPCEQYWVDITVGAKFFSVSVRNPNICSDPGCITDPNKPGCKWKEFAVVAPFSVEWIDKSTTAWYTLPTRQNTPTNIPIEATTITIPDSLDRTIVTNTMQLILTIQPRETSVFFQERSAWMSGYYYSPNPGCIRWRHEYLGLRRTDATRSLGLQLYTQMQECGLYDHKIHWWLRRKQPTPPFTFKIRYGVGCSYPGAFSTYDNCGWFNRYLTRAVVTNAPIHSYHHCGSWCDDWYLDADDGGPSRFVWEYYEDFRLHRSSVTVVWADLKAKLVGAAPGTSVVVIANGTLSMPVRLTWRNMTELATGLTWQQEVASAEQAISLQVAPPFAIQDLWVTVHNENGKRLFTEIETRVPYRGELGVGPGQPGWAWALTDRWDAATEMTIVVRCNRQNRLGATPEEKRVALLRRFVEDNDGDTSLMIAPIPKTIMSQDGLMGVVAAQAFAPNEVIGRVTYASCLTSNISRAYFDRHLLRKLNATEGFWTQYDRPEVAWNKEHVMMTLMLATDAVSESDYSTAFWTIADAFYPQRPTMLPHFWDQVQLNRLLGFCELPRIIGYELGNWTNEHALIAQGWPWFGAEVPLEKWLAFRGHVRRSTYAQGDELFLPPWVHLMRHSSDPPNVALWAEWHTADITLTAANVSVAFQEELRPALAEPGLPKHAYLLRYGAVPSSAPDSASVPSWDGFVTMDPLSRAPFIAQLEQRNGLTTKQALQMFANIMQVKLTALPITIDGLGSTPDQVNMAAALLAAEKSVSAFQISDALAEAATLP